MKLVAITLLFSSISLIAAEPGWFNSLKSLVSVGNSNDLVTDDIFAKAYADTKNTLTNAENKVKEEEERRKKNLPTFAEGSLAHYATQVFGSATNAAQNAFTGVRNTASGLTAGLIATAANAGMDLLLAEYKLISGATGVGSKLSLPDIQTSAYGVELKATNGSFSSLSSLEKSGKIHVTIENADSLTLEIPMRFSEMTVEFGYYEVTAFMFMSTSGSFSVSIGKNNVVIKLRLGMDSACAISIDSVSITELGEISVKLEGLGRYASMFTEKITNLLIGYLKDIISRHIQDAVDSNLRKALDNNSMICSKFVPI